jgi:hypothetical protein
MQPYGKLESIAPGLWTSDGEWYSSPFRRRMTIMALSSGEILVHNPFILSIADLTQLKSLGPVVGIIMPNAFHGDETPWMADQFPDARVFVPLAASQKMRKKSRVDGSLELDWPTDWKKDVDCISVNGLRFAHESVFLHVETRSLVVTDLVFNLSADAFRNSFEKKIMALNRVGNGFGPSRLFDILFTRDKNVRNASIREILNRDFDRVIMNHGDRVDTGGKEKMREAFSERLLP